MASVIHIGLAVTAGNRDGSRNSEAAFDGVWITGDTTVPMVPDSLRLTSPNGGEKLTCGIPYAVTWESYGSIEKVNIQYRIEGGDWQPASENLENTGSYSWQVPAAPSDDVLVRVCSTSGEVMDESDAPFSIAGETVSIRSAGGRDYYTFMVSGFEQAGSVAAVLKITILDLKGNVVRELPVNAERINWDLFDDRGRKVANGIFLVQLNGSSDIKTCKIIVR